MAGENTVSTMDGLYKEVYPNKELDSLTPTSSVLYDIIPFPEDDKIGDSFHQPVLLTSEHGFTYNGDGGGLVSLNDPINATLKDATTKGFEMIGRSRMTYGAASRAAQGGKRAFAKAWGVILKNLRIASMKRLELTLLRGQKGLGVVESRSNGAIVITEATWSPTTFAGMEGAVLECFSTDAATATQRDGDLTISAVDFSTRTVTVTATANAYTNVAANDILFVKGAKTATGWNEAAGLIKIAQNTGTLFGVAGASYAMWTGNVKSSIGVPTMGRILDMATLAVEKGGLDEKAFVIVPPRAWEVLNSDLGGLRVMDGSYSKEKAENGTQRICYYGQAGELELRAHPFLQRGEMCIFPASAYKRVGSADVQMGVPGTNGQEVFFHLPDKNAVEARTFSDQGLFADKLATSVVGTGITYP